MADKTLEVELWFSASFAFDAEWNELPTTRAEA